MIFTAEIPGSGSGAGSENAEKGIFFFWRDEPQANRISSLEDVYLSLSSFFSLRPLRTLRLISFPALRRVSLTQSLLVSLLKDFLGREHPVYGRGKSRVHGHLDDDFNNLLA